MKDVATPVPQNEVRAVIKKSLENAALVNYERLSEEARIEAEMKNKQGKAHTNLTYSNQCQSFQINRGNGGRSSDYTKAKTGRFDSFG